MNCLAGHDLIDELKMQHIMKYVGVRRARAITVHLQATKEIRQVGPITEGQVLVIK